MTKIHLYLLCWNESKIIPFIMDYYQRYVDHVYVFDNQSDDGSVEMLERYPNVTVYPYESGGEIRDDIYLEIKNNAWKQSRGVADFVIVCDMDEVVWSADVATDFDYMKEHGYTICAPKLHQAISQEFPESGKSLIHEQCVAYRDYKGVKSLVFDPNAILEINYGIGGHECHPTGKINRWEDPYLNTFHFKCIGRKYMLERKNQFGKRLSRENRANKWGMKYVAEDSFFTNFYDNALKRCRPMREFLKPSRERTDDKQPACNTSQSISGNHPEAYTFCAKEELPQKTAAQKVLFVSHGQEYACKRFRKLKNELSGIADVEFVEHGRDVTDEDLYLLGYQRLSSRILPGSNHHILLYYSLKYPDYDYYWNIEYDVLFTGNWKTLFEAAAKTDADLLTNFIESRNEKNAQWPWWNYSNHTGLWKSFNPIYRLSKRACRFLDEQLKNDRHGHHEVEIPTCLISGGFSYRSFGELGFVVPPENPAFENPTFGYNLRFSQFDQKDTLYHPVKYETEYS